MIFPGHIKIWILSTLFISLSVMADNVIPVTVKSLEQLVFHPVKKAPAQVVTLQNSLLSAQLSALVEQVSVQVGDQVTKGQELVKLECDDFELSKQQLVSEKKSLEAEFSFAKYQFERSSKLLKSKSVSQETHRRQQSELNKLQAKIQLLISKIKLADIKISRCVIKAPFDGVVAERRVDVGENVAPRTPLIRLIDVNNLEVEVQVPIVILDDLDYKSLAFVYRNQHYPVVMRAVIPSIETRARHQRVRLSFVAEKALPDAFGMVEITQRESNIPANYLLSRDGKVGIFIIKEQSGEQHKGQHVAEFYVIPNALIGRATAIDLPLNTKVIIEGRNALDDGQKVAIQSDPSASR